MKIVDKLLLRSFAGSLRCEGCGKLTPNGCDAHHAVHTKGNCRLDIKFNLVALCRSCHQGIDNKAGRELCIRIIAERERCRPEDVEAVCNFFKQQDKGRTLADLYARAYCASATVIAWSMIRQVLDTMPDQSPAPRPLTKRPRKHKKTVWRECCGTMAGHQHMSQCPKKRKVRR